MSTFLFDLFTTNKTRLVFTIVGGNDKVNTSVDTNNVTDIRDITFLDIICNRDMQKILTMFINKLGCTKLINCVVKVFRHTFSEIWQFDTTVSCIY